MIDEKALQERINTLFERVRKVEEYSRINAYLLIAFGVLMALNGWLVSR